MKTVLYITYIDFDLNKMASGSYVRPQKIYNAWLEMGYKAILLNGSIQKKYKKERLKNIEKIKTYLSENTPDFCYIESSGSYITFKEDKKLIKLIHKKGIKIGYFYRDAYHKLGRDVLFNGKKVKIYSKEFLRYLYIKCRMYFDDMFLKKYIDIVYFPSMEMSLYFNFKNMKELPPAGEIINYCDNKKSGVIYVGGITKSYGIDLLMETFYEINKLEKIDLILICREKEVNNIPDKYLNEPWLKIRHASGKELKKYYEKAKIAVMPKNINYLYNSFAVSVKIYEYMSYNLPIVATETLVVKRIFKENKIGLVADFDVNDFKDKIK